MFTPEEENFLKKFAQDEMSRIQADVDATLARQAVQDKEIARVEAEATLRAQKEQEVKDALIEFDNTYISLVK